MFRVLVALRFRVLRLNPRNGLVVSRQVSLFSSTSKPKMKPQSAFVCFCSFWEGLQAVDGKKLTEKPKPRASPAVGLRLELDPQGQNPLKGNYRWGV